VSFDGPLADLYEALKQEQLCQGTRLAKDLRNLLFALTLQLQERAELEAFGPDFIYERYCLLNTAGLELARYLGVPLVLEVNSPLVLEQQRMRGLSLPAVARAAERLLFTSADHVIVVSEWLRQYVIDEGADPNRVSVVPNAADPDLFCPRLEPSTLRRQLGWNDRFVVGFVGSMKSWHGISTLLEALQILGGTESRFRALLVGSGPELPGLQQEAEQRGLGDSVHLTGAMPHEMVPDAVDAMDVTVAPYAPDADGYFSPVKLFEYMAMARPVVAARVGQVEEVIEHGRTGWLYTPGDARQLAELIRLIADDPRLCRQAGTAARERVLAQHTWQRNAERVTAIAECAAADKRERSRLMTENRREPRSAGLAL
jgi:glycosyltransferase involved in cell wall biosynthesis